MGQKLVDMEDYELDHGHTYTGQMRAHETQKGKFVPHGEGQMTFHDNRIVDGLWENGQVQNGTLIYPNGDRYEGEFDHGNPQGQGKLKETDGTIYEGNWENGKIVQGTEILPNGEIYNGNFHNRKRHGYGE